MVDTTCCYRTQSMPGRDIRFDLLPNSIIQFPLLERIQFFGTWTSWLNYDGTDFAIRIPKTLKRVDFRLFTNRTNYTKTWSSVWQLHTTLGQLFLPAGVNEQDSNKWQWGDLESICELVDYDDFGVKAGEVQKAKFDDSFVFEIARLCPNTDQRLSEVSTIQIYRWVFITS